MGDWEVVAGKWDDDYFCSSPEVCAEVTFAIVRRLFIGRLENAENNKLLNSLFLFCRRGAFDNLFFCLEGRYMKKVWETLF